MIFVEKINKQFGSKVIFRDVSFHLRPKEKVGLIGENGTGKTTLYKVIVGRESLDSGQVTLRKGLRYGLLEQDQEGGKESVLERVVLGDPHFMQVKTEMETLEADQKFQDRYGELQHEFERLGGYDREARAKIILQGLGFKPGQWDKSLDQLSGGWRMRVELSRILLQRPDVLLLDEPSNHLDLQSVIWLESFLLSYEGSVLLISHDRKFLNTLTTRIFELDRASLTVYSGNYDAYERLKEERREQLESQAANQSRRIAEVERFIERFRAKNTKATQVQSRIKMLDKMERVQTSEKSSKAIHFRFPQPVRTGRNILEMQNVTKIYGDLKVYENFSVTLERGWKVALAGENGAGKSTLLKMMAGVLLPDSGEVKQGVKVSRSYFAQHQGETLNFKHTVLESLQESAPGLLRTQQRNILGAFLFSGEDVEKKVSVLSGGEKSRLALARMLCGSGVSENKIPLSADADVSAPPSCILLDEPTNHLDIRSREHLAAVLSDYEGSLVIISHDRFFLDGFVNRVWEVANGKVCEYDGNYSEYEQAKLKEEPIEARVKSTEKTSPANSSLEKERKRKEAEERNLRYKKLKPLEKRLAEVESRLEVLMMENEQLESKLAEPDIYESDQKDRLMKTMEQQRSLKEEEQALMKEWDELTISIEQIQEN
ncbi:MAG: ABC-F family ATP-binding cassette domain-containing protein [Nitrospinae bacterium]|nr:ABC-F family ATP-binding cassette domain-containing protein [Nitrospinota bacterium]